MDPYPSSILQITADNLHFGEVAFLLAAIAAFLYFSGLLSASEIAFFSLSPQDISEIESSDHTTDKRVKELLLFPEHLLGTILITNNLVNVSIIILSSIFLSILVDLSSFPIWGFILHVAVISFLLLLFGEIMPKIHATQNPLKVTRRTSAALTIVSIILRPLSKILVKSTKIFNKQLEKHKQSDISLTEISQALDITSAEMGEDKDILKGITTFGNTTADKIMTSRTDIIALNINDSFDEVINCIVTNEYSRIPVYANSFDDIRGLLYAKDLIPYLGKTTDFKWQSLLRTPYYIPETVKIDDLLQHFQKDRTHIAIVVDEFGGTSGLVTLEDILEEVVGDISDEYDDETQLYSKIDNHTYIYEAKIYLSDFAKSLNLDSNFFDGIDTDIDTIAGLILDIKGEIPQIGATIKFKNFIFEVTEADNRRIKRVKLTIRDI